MTRIHKQRMINGFQVPRCGMCGDRMPERTSRAHYCGRCLDILDAESDRTYQASKRTERLEAGT